MIFSFKDLDLSFDLDFDLRLDLVDIVELDFLILVDFRSLIGLRIFGVRKLCGFGSFCKSYGLGDGYPVRGFRL